MTDNGVASVLELNSLELDGDNNTNSKYKCNFSVDNISLITGLSSEFCSNGGTGSGALGLNLLQNFDEGNLFQCDINGVYEWIRHRTDSLSSTDLESMRIDCSEAIITTSELTSSTDVTAGGSEVDAPVHIDTAFSGSVSPSLTSQSQSDNLSATLLDELTCLPNEEQLLKPESLIGESVFQYSLQKELDRLNSFTCDLSSERKLLPSFKDQKEMGSAKCNIEKDSVIPTPMIKSVNSLPYVKVPKKCILSGKIIKYKRDLPPFPKIVVPLLSESHISENDNLKINSLEGSSNLDSNCDNVNENEVVMQKKVRLKSMLESSILQTNTKEDSVSLLNGQDKASSKAVVAISTNKIEDLTEIVIKTEKGEELYTGKASDLLKVTSSTPDLLLRFDSSSKSTTGTIISKEQNTNESLSANIEDDEKSDEQATNEDEPITEALKALGLTNDQWDSFEVIRGQQRIWFCPLEDCDSLFNKLSSLKIHILTHYKLRPFKCDYKNCEWSFYTNFRLKRHKETHLGKKEFKCPEKSCNRSFTTIYNLHTHSKLHERPADLLCPVPGCNQAFQTKRNMESHLKEHGTEHAPYVCNYDNCKKRYYSTSALQSHIRTHLHSIEDLQCEYCFKTFDKPCRLRAHLRSHTGVKPYKCNYEGCEWAFTTSSKLHRHQAKHTQNRRFLCHLCSKAFLRSEHLKDHTLKHYITKSFVCPVTECGTQFTAKSSLYVHSRKHRQKEINEQNGGTGKKEAVVISVLAKDLGRISCPLKNCCETFTSKEEMTLHLQTSHQNFDKINKGVIARISSEGVEVSLPECVENNNGVDFMELSTYPGVTSTCEINVPVITQPVPLNSASCDSASGDLETKIMGNHIDIGSARTGITYQDALAERELRKRLNKRFCFNGKKQYTVTEETSVVESMRKENCGVHVIPDIILNTGLLGGSQCNERSLMLQDELVCSPDLYGYINEETNSAYYKHTNNEGEFYQVYILDSSNEKQCDFEQSTINLRDLE